MLAAPEHQGKNGQVKVIWRTLRIILHPFMFHAHVFEAYINFVLIYGRSYFPSTTNHRLDKKRRQSDHVVNSCDRFETFNITFTYFILSLYKEILHIWDKGITHVSQSKKGVYRYLCWSSTNYHEGYLFYVPHKRKIASSYDVVFDEIFSNALAYTSHPYSE